MALPLPTAPAIDRLAIAMAAGSGLRLDKMTPEDRAFMRRSANAALLYLGLPASPSAPRHLAETLEGIVGSIRAGADAIDADPERRATEFTVATLYARATEAEALSRVILGLPEAEAADEEAV